MLARTKKDSTELKAIKLTTDHSPALLEERKRVEQSGGTVEDTRVMGRLGVSRSFGDARLKGVGVISQPGKFRKHTQLSASDYRC